jgi:tRNA (guanine-N7-)-methyltransferase
MTDTPQPARQSLIFKLENIMDPLDWPKLFPEPQPVEVELGSGDGSFLVEYASMRRDVNFVGVERLLGRLRKIERKSLRLGLANVRPLRIESAYFMRHLVAPGSIQSVHIYFPDPWPKRRHRRNRIVNEAFPEVAARALGHGGKVFLRTDDTDYFAQMEEVFAAHRGFARVETPVELAAVATDFEREFNAKGIPTLRAAFAKI